MQTIREWLGNENTAVHYLFDDEIDWDVVPDDEINMLIKYTLTGEDSSDRLNDILFSCSDGGQSASLAFKLINNQADEIYRSCRNLREMTIEYIKYVCDKEIDIAIDKRADYGREYAIAAAEDSKQYEYDAQQINYQMAGGK